MLYMPEDARHPFYSPTVDTLANYSVGHTPSEKSESFDLHWHANDCSVGNGRVFQQESFKLSRRNLIAFHLDQFLMRRPTVSMAL